MKQAMNRRRFMFATGAGGAAILAGRVIDVAAAEMPAVDTSSPQAMALGYVADATTTDTAKFARYEAGQICGNCQLYMGAAGTESGPCPLFAGQAVAAAGWCNSWVKKPG
ncbi:MAG: high-potential iron-sulfur protein [Gammaproteobacteria bacterium]|jgi:hypothetical protein